MAVGWRRWFGWFFRADGLTYGEFYAEDERRRQSEEVAYGSGWRDASDPAARWSLRWFEATGELCAMRHPAPDYAEGGDPERAPALRTLGSSFTVEILGRVETRALVDRALAGWESHVDEADGLPWVRGRLSDDQPR